MFTKIKNYKVPIFAYYKYKRDLGEPQNINLLDCACLQDSLNLEASIKQNWVQYFVFNKSKNIGAKLEFKNLNLQEYNFIEIRFDIFFKKNLGYYYLKDLPDIDILDCNLLGGDLTNYLRQQLQIPSIIVDKNRFSRYKISRCILKYPHLINKILSLSSFNHINAFIFPLEIDNYQINIIFLRKDFFLNNTSIKFFDNQFNYFF